MESLPPYRIPPRAEAFDLRLHAWTMVDLGRQRAISFKGFAPVANQVIANTQIASDSAIRKPLLDLFFYLPRACDLDQNATS